MGDCWCVALLTPLGSSFVACSLPALASRRCLLRSLCRFNPQSAVAAMRDTLRADHPTTGTGCRWQRARSGDRRTAERLATGQQDDGAADGMTPRTRTNQHAPGSATSAGDLQRGLARGSLKKQEGRKQYAHEQGSPSLIVTSSNCTDISAVIPSSSVAIAGSKSRNLHAGAVGTSDRSQSPLQRRSNSCIGRVDNSCAVGAKEIRKKKLMRPGMRSAGSAACRRRRARRIHAAGRRRPSRRVSGHTSSVAFSIRSRLTTDRQRESDRPTRLPSMPLCPVPCHGLVSSHWWPPDNDRRDRRDPSVSRGGVSCRIPLQ